MNPVANLSIYCVIAFALLGSMVYMLLNTDKNSTVMYFLSLLNPDQQELYRDITQERMNLYLQGFVLGTIIAIIYLKVIATDDQPVYCIFVALVLGIAYVHYTIMPKSTYMLEHIDNAEQAKAWLEIYKIMKYRCNLGMLLGIIALPFLCLIPAQCECPAMLTSLLIDLQR